MAQFPTETSESGAFERQPDEFRNWPAKDDPALQRAGRFHLYVSLACPWAHRTLIVRQLLSLEERITASVVDPIRDDKGWRFTEGEGHGPDPVNGFQYLSEAYAATDPTFQGRITVPVLWDRDQRRIVNNSEDDICRIMHELFRSPTAGSPNLFPIEFVAEQDQLSNAIYEKVNNGVYRAGFATTQSAYEEAVGTLFDMLNDLESRLENRAFLFGDQPVETDWRLFCTLIRFDAVYHGHFKCNIRRILDYPNLHRYLKMLYAIPDIAETVNFDHIKRHYYMTHDDINPTRIVPVGPAKVL